MDKIHDIMAHDAEILSIEYSPLIDNCKNHKLFIDY